jgi:hypothetical protein
VKSSVLPFCSEKAQQDCMEKAPREMHGASTIKVDGAIACTTKMHDFHVSTLENSSRSLRNLQGPIDIGAGVTKSLGPFCALHG